jgi:riboflavin synthase
MFTGIVEEVGAIVARQPRGPGARFTIACTFDDLALGDSVCVGGVCLTVDELAGRGFEIDATAETLERSTLKHLKVGTPVNLERALKPSSRMGGHYVVGHADGIGRLLSKSPLGEATSMRFSVPGDLGRFVAAKGSIAVDGVSLTTNEVSKDTFDVVLIPHTLRRTTLGALEIGSEVTIEVDLLARYVARQLAFEGAPSFEQKLKDGGFL